MISYNWLEKLEVGSKVIVSGPYHSSPDKICTVVRLTKTQIIIDERSVKFRRIDGSEFGEYCNQRCLRQATSNNVNEINNRQRKDKLVDMLRCRKWNILSLDQLEYLHITVAPMFEDEK